MKASKILIIIISVLVIIFIAVISLLTIPWLLIFGGIWLSPDPPKPQITSAEFPFELVYKLDEEIITIDDIFVCEYDGIGMNEGRGKYIKWKAYIKSSNQENLVLLVDDTKQIICDIGSPDYYMGDPQYYETYAEHHIVPRLFLLEGYGDITTSHYLSKEEMENYEIEFISWEFSKPIENTFK